MEQNNWSLREAKGLRDNLDRSVFEERGRVRVLHDSGRLVMRFGEGGGHVEMNLVTITLKKHPLTFVPHLVAPL